MRIGAAVPVALALAFAGCSADYVETNASSVLLLVERINAGSPVLSDVRGGETGNTIINCLTLVEVSARIKNPNQPASPVDDVRLTRYDVSYRRADGRAVEGVDVPYRISGNMTAVVPAGGDLTEVVIDLVRHQAKIEPPLINMVGLQVVTMFADVTVHGATISGRAVAGQGSVQVTFADFAEGTETCETAGGGE
jgi:hypothetical protein